MCIQQFLQSSYQILAKNIEGGINKIGRYPKTRPQSDGATNGATYRGQLPPGPVSLVCSYSRPYYCTMRGGNSFFVVIFSNVGALLNAELSNFTEFSTSNLFVQTLCFIICIALEVISKIPRMFWKKCADLHIQQL